MLEVASEQLKKVAKDFYTAVNIKIDLYDADGNLIYSYPTSRSNFCNIIKNNNALRKKCVNCTKEGLSECMKIRGTHIYRCHMNLAEAAIPLIESGIIIGYMMLGQLLVEDDIGKVRQRIEENHKLFGLDAEECIDAMKQLRVVTAPLIVSAANLMNLCACYLHVNRIIKNNSDVIAFQINEYIDDNIGKRLSVSDLCRRFYMSRSKLYNISKNEFGMGIADYVRKKKIEYAKNVLAKSKDTVSHISAMVGFEDDNYFIRVFKRYVGVTPNKFRKMNKTVYDKKLHGN